MNDKIAESLKSIESHVEVLLRIPTGEQYISHMQSVIAGALLDINRCLEEIANERTQP